ncbi:MAG: 30S ribosomal protein S18 [Elusimicrobiota bacterium]|nr:30S ribosomal protein S18 [Elusimicrobiota bacterium]MDH5661588.1 30S ribosomal protein S18 [Elusimicrobiota bacterium]
MVPNGEKKGRGRKGGFDSRRRRYRPFRKKVCRFCVKKIDYVDYKDIGLLRSYITDRGKILSNKITGNCAKHQRNLSRAVKRARVIGLLPFTTR